VPVQHCLYRVTSIGTQLPVPIPVPRHQYRFKIVCTASPVPVQNCLYLWRVPRHQYQYNIACTYPGTRHAPVPVQHCLYLCQYRADSTGKTLLYLCRYRATSTGTTLYVHLPVPRHQYQYNIACIYAGTAPPVPVQQCLDLCRYRATSTGSLLFVHSSTHWMKPCNPPPPPHLGLPRWTTSPFDPLYLLTVGQSQYSHSSTPIKKTDDSSSNKI
jgi:hypothetical protein